ncbi:helix-turn-helix domain-containing protein [Dyadobacter sandarakinus]|uniref:Helix-turn-helix transcriptional regulator n=1 Tax=Dyadobacter sandarakinus TaxID=2747268 RepID=A0ABX7I2J3_9BACT|nr:helix-turn-helix transcriptional regulator [Dyadobacter sandarakinus]QRQ99937.1 helix-turn-helix transcriptional regulator [Dyadobacter sandarakinus]
MTTVGKRIKKCRENLNMSQEQLAAIMDKAGRATISNWETGKNEPTLTEFKKLAEILKTTVSHLIGEAPMFEEPRENYVLVKKDDLIELQRKALEREEERNRDLQEQLEKVKKQDEQTGES